MTEMAHSVQEVANSAQNSLAMVQQVETASESGRQIMSTNISTIRQLETRLIESVEAVGDLRKMSSQIGSILDVIRNIAEQTNLWRSMLRLKRRVQENKAAALRWWRMKFAFLRSAQRNRRQKSNR